MIPKANASLSKPYIDGMTIENINGEPLNLYGVNIRDNYQEKDIKWLSDNGYNAIRVTILWQTIEPTEGVLDWSGLDNTVQWAEKYHIYVQLDFHQWQYSNYFHWDSMGTGCGFPAWIVSAGGYTNDEAGQQAFSDDFFLKRGYGAVVWDKYENFILQIVTRYKDYQNVWAYEPINEPMVGSPHIDDARVACNARYTELIQAIRAIDPETIIVLHYIDSGFNQKQDFPNIAWTKSAYSEYGVGTTKSQIDKYLTNREAEFNIVMDVPWIISETGSMPAMKDSAEYFLTTLLTDYKSMLNNGQSVWYIWDYGYGITGGYVSPRNADGSDSWIQPILANIINSITPPKTITQVDTSSWTGFAMSVENRENLDMWTSALDKGSKWGFTVIRVPFLFPIDYANMDQILALIDQHGAKAILDFHCLVQYPAANKIGTVGFISDWVEVVNHYKNDTRVLGWEIANEPDPTQWDTSIVTSYDHIKALTDVVDAIRAIDPSRVIIWPPSSFWGDTNIPQGLIRDNIVLSTHPYSYGDKSTWAELKVIADYRISQIAKYENQFSGVWVGEIECHPGGATNPELEKQYVVYMLSWSLSNGHGFNYWKYGNTYDDGGQNPDEIISLAYADSGISLPVTTTAISTVSMITTTVEETYTKEPIVTSKISQRNNLNQNNQNNAPVDSPPVDPPLDTSIGAMGQIIEFVIIAFGISFLIAIVNGGTIEGRSLIGMVIGLTIVMFILVLINK
jgi:hypothetical protein